MLKYLKNVKNLKKTFLSILFNPSFKVVQEDRYHAFNMQIIERVYFLYRKGFFGWKLLIEDLWLNEPIEIHSFKELYRKMKKPNAMKTEVFRYRKLKENPFSKYKEVIFTDAEDIKVKYPEWFI